MSSEEYSVCRLRVVADAAPGAIARVLERFENLNVLPRRVSAEHGINGLFHIEVDVAGVPDRMLTLIAAKLRQATTTVNAHWFKI